jgi:hydrogenase-4 component B
MSPEWLAVSGIVLAAGSGVPGLFFDRTGKLTGHSPASSASAPSARLADGRSTGGERIAAALVALGAAAAIIGAALALARPGEGIRLPWPVPGGALHVQIDALSAMFVLQIFVVALVGAVYGLGYWRQAEHPENGRKLRLFYGLLVAGLALVVVARNAILFLAGWEVMALAAFLTITTEDERREVREVGYVYLVATRVGTLCLFAMFALLHSVRGDFELGAPPSTARAGAIFLLGVAGFGLKAGLMPMHVWLPGAHANAPSHISAMMSGVLIKVGIYGLVRLASFYPHPPLWWGGLVLALGAVSGVLGVAFAIGQHDLKRLLAYHSVENIGIICMGLGMALVGRSLGRSDLTALGLGGALLHTWNHGLFKALLFLSAGSVLHATHTREIDHLGGLGRAMPSTALFFLVGAVAICGLPPLNGFVSELLVYLGLLRSVSLANGSLWLVGAFGAPALALIGALAVACFVKVYGAVFLGEPRAVEARHAHECGASMLLPMALLAALCAFIGLGAPLVAPILERAIAAWAPEWSGLRPLAEVAPLGWVTRAGFGVVGALVLVGVALRGRLRGAAEAGTWDCGYARPAPSMQYTSSSFAEMLVAIFAWALRPDAHRPRLAAVFPRPEGFHSHVPEAVLERAILPSTHQVGRAFQRLHFLQRGSVQRYLLYILAALLFFFLWRWP